MNNKLNIVSSLSFAPISQVLTYQAQSPGPENVSATVTVSSWTDIPFVSGSIDYIVEVATEKTGTLFQSKLQCRLKEDLVIPRCIVRLQMEDGNTYILGDLDTPVYFLKTLQLGLKSLKTTHESWHSPYILSL